MAATQILDPAVVGLLIPLLAIAIGGALAIIKAITHHRERMAKIGMGVDPDYEPPTEQSQPGIPNQTKSPY